MKYIANCLLIIIILFAVACKKDNDIKGKDIVSTATIQGQVFNQCTDSGLVNCTVFLKENGNTIGQLNSGANGNFTFSNVQIHSSSSYSYAVETIDNPDGGGGLPPITGDILALNKGNLNQSYVLHVIPETLQWFLYFPKLGYPTIADTFMLTIQQRVLHKNLPTVLNYSYVLEDSPAHSPQGSGFAPNYIWDPSFSWMGWWYSTLTKTKNGITTTKVDSFYVPWNASSTDTIPWP